MISVAVKSHRGNMYELRLILGYLFHCRDKSSRTDFVGFDSRFRIEIGYGRNHRPHVYNVIAIRRQTRANIFVGNRTDYYFGFIFKRLAFFQKLFYVFGRTRKQFDMFDFFVHQAKLLHDGATHVSC